MKINAPIATSRVKKERYCAKKSMTTKGSMANPEIPVKILCIFVLVPPTSGANVQAI
jgi:hypothetical protein